MNLTNLIVSTSIGVGISLLGIGTNTQPYVAQAEYLEPTPVVTLDTPKSELVAIEEAITNPLPPEPVYPTLDGLQGFYDTYKQYYETADGCHPYIIAAIHYRETNFGNTNAWNGQGAFQNIRNRYPSQSVVTDWEAQVKQACEHLRQSVGWAGLTNIEDEQLIGQALSKYNGCNNKVWNQCSYVVNNTQYMALGTSSKCAVDGCAYMVTDYKHGTLSIINQLNSL